MVQSQGNGVNDTTININGGYIESWAKSAGAIFVAGAGTNTINNAGTIDDGSDTSLPGGPTPNATGVSIAGNQPATINTEDLTIGTVIENRRIVELPLNGRNFLHMVELTPNVSASFSGSGSSGPRHGGDRSPQQLSIGGGRSEWNYFTLDGINNTDVNFKLVHLPAVDRCAAGIQGADRRLLGGVRPATSQINVLTKSGTNVYHGTVFEFLRNDTIDAHPYTFASMP